MTLTEKVEKLAEMVKAYNAAPIVYVEPYDSPDAPERDFLMYCLGPCREYSGILRGIISLWEDLGVEYYGEIHLLEAIDTWKQVLKETQEK